MLLADALNIRFNGKSATAIRLDGQKVWPRPSVPVTADLSGGGTLSAIAQKWSPATLPGLGLWLDASTITGKANGDSVTTWTDTSPAARHAVASATAPLYRPTGLNSRPAVEFVGTLTAANRMRIPGWGTALSGKTEYTLFLVANTRTVGHYPVIFSAPYDAAWAWLIEYQNTIPSQMYWGHGGGAYRLYQAAIAVNTPYYYSFHFKPGDPHFFKNGTEVTTFTPNGAMQMTVPDIGADVSFGGYQTGQPLGLDGFVSEVIWYDHALTDTERVKVENYLKSKWSIT